MVCAVPERSEEKGVSMEQYDVYLHDVPKVSEDGKKSLPIKPHRTEQF